MSAKKDGGPAFPQKASDEDGCLYEPGMSLRDYFANGPISDHEWVKLQSEWMSSKEYVNRIPTVANLRYFRADAMIEARKVK